MKFILIPFEGTDTIRFGDSKNNIRNRFDYVPVSDKRGGSDGESYDFFEKDGIFLYYDDEDKLNAIEFASPAEPLVHNINFLGLNFDVARDILSKIDNEFKKDGAGGVAPQLGIALYAPFVGEEEAPVESVLAHRKGYYDDELS